MITSTIRLGTLVAWFSATDARTLPPVSQVPVLVAATGRARSGSLRGTVTDGWVTTGPTVETLEEWYAGLAESRRVLEDALVAAGRGSGDLDRYLNLDSAPQYSLDSPAVFTDMVGRAAGLGFTDVITHWPRPDAPYAGSVSTLETVATDVIPALRGG